MGRQTRRSAAAPIGAYLLDRVQLAYLRAASDEEARVAVLRTMRVRVDDRALRALPANLCVRRPREG